jgi:hypothetical protein
LTGAEIVSVGRDQSPCRILRDDEVGPVQDWEVGVIVAVDAPDQPAGYRGFVIATFPSVAIVYKETTRQQWLRVDAALVNAVVSLPDDGYLVLSDARAGR